MWISRSIAFVISGSAGAPFEVENFRPLYSGGLCEAVKLIAPIALRRTVSNETHGVGTSRVQRNAWMPLKARIFAASERELLGEEARVVRDDDAASLLPRFLEVVGDALAGDADVVEGEVLADDAAPAGGPELDHELSFSSGEMGTLAQRRQSASAE